MATEPLNQIYTAGLNVYASVLEIDTAKFFDFADNTFKLLSAPPTTPYVALTEKTDAGGVGSSAYVGSIDLALINNTGAVKRVVVAFYRRLGGSPAPSTDTLIFQGELSIQAGQLTTSPGADNVTLHIRTSFTSSAGTTFKGIVYGVGTNGAPVALTGSATLDIKELASGSDLLNLTAASPNASGEFEFSQGTPGFTADRQYRFLAEVTEDDGTVHRGVEYQTVMG